MNFITGWDRQQVHLLPERIEDYVGADNLVRFLDAWVETLDLRALGFLFPKADARGRGAPAYPPADLLRLYLYGYCHQIRSSRRLEAECGRNLELLWLLRKLNPRFQDHRRLPQKQRRRLSRRAAPVQSTVPSRKSLWWRTPGH